MPRHYGIAESGVGFNDLTVSVDPGYQVYSDQVWGYIENDVPENDSGHIALPIYTRRQAEELIAALYRALVNKDGKEYDSHEEFWKAHRPEGD